MEINIEERKENPLLERRELRGTVKHTDEATPSTESLKEALADELGSNKEDIEIDKIFTVDGQQKSRFWAKEAGSVSKKTEKPEEGEEEEGDSVDYEEVLSGTISEAKEKIRDMESPDYKKLLETEKDNKDRKGMKQFLEKKVGD